MPYGAMPWVRQGRVLTAHGERIVIDTPAWFAWLAHISSFCYSGQHPWVRLTVRCEKRRQHSYWYAYCKIDAKLHNIYLGKREQLTQTRLDGACQAIYQRARRKAVMRTDGGKQGTG